MTTTPTPDGAPEQPAPSSDADVADKMFGSTEALRTTYGRAIQESVHRLGDFEGLTAEQKQAHSDDAAHTYFEARLSADQSARIHSLIARHAQHPADDATVDQWAAESRRRLRETYGEGANADRRLAAAQAFIDARPGLRARLNATGLGSHPDVVLALAEKADVMRVQPRKRS